MTSVLSGTSGTLLLDDLYVLYCTLP